LWRRLEAREDKSTRHATAILGHTFDVALPCELTLEQNIFLARDFVREQFVRKGYAVDWAIHAADPRGDSRNIHLHILVPLRKIEGESFGKKDRYDRSQLRQQIRTWRKSWATLANRHLKRYGHQAQIDERSYRARGIKQPPTKHRGVKAKTQRKFLDGMRKASLPKAPIVRTTKHFAADGTITMRRSIKHSVLNKIRFEPTSSTRPLSGGIGGATSGSVGASVKHAAKDGTLSMRVVVPASELDKTRSPSKPETQPAHAPPQSRRGWPAAAIRDWADWGCKNPARFFALWPELSGGGGGAILDGANP
jgi:hypothetical protein